MILVKHTRPLGPSDVFDDDTTQSCFSQSLVLNIINFNTIIAVIILKRDIFTNKWINS